MEVPRLKTAKEIGDTLSMMIQKLAEEKMEAGEPGGSLTEAVVLILSTSVATALSHTTGVDNDIFPGQVMHTFDLLFDELTAMEARKKEHVA